MPYLAVDLYGEEFCYQEAPSRSVNGREWTSNEQWEEGRMYVILPPGSIKCLIGRELSWSDNPVELTEEILKDKP